jgi:hypothetical protein
MRHTFAVGILRPDRITPPPPDRLLERLAQHAKNERLPLDVRADCEAAIVRLEQPAAARRAQVRP